MDISRTIITGKLLNINSILYIRWHYYIKFLRVLTVLWLCRKMACLPSSRAGISESEISWCLQLYSKIISTKRQRVGRRRGRDNYQCGKTVPTGNLGNDRVLTVPLFSIFSRFLNFQSEKVWGKNSKSTCLEFVLVVWKLYRHELHNHWMWLKWCSGLYRLKAHLPPIKKDRNKSNELTATQEVNRKNSGNPKKKIRKKEGRK